MGNGNSEFVRKRISSLLKDIEDLEKKTKTPSHDSASKIWREFIKFHESVLIEFPENKLLPKIDYNRDPQKYWSDAMISQMKTTLRGISDAVGSTSAMSLEQTKDPITIIELLCSRFHLVVKQLRNRHNDRETLDVSDEYDVQDLIHALLMINFDDIRKEEWTPSYAGSSSRMDFLLKNEKIVIEAKKIRKGLGAKELGEELLVDIAKYQTHSDCERLICFVYDPEGKIPNPRGLESDLSKKHGKIIVKVIIKP